MNKSYSFKDWYKLNSICKTCAPCVMFGITSKANVPDFLYPGRSPRRGSTVIWNPEKDAHVSIGSYVEACRNHDQEAIAKLESIGVPAYIDFGYGPKDDMSSTYVELKKPRAKKAPSVKVMRAEFPAEYEDGTKFAKGDVVKILFRKKFVRDVAGVKKFRNAYERPTEDEVREFIRSERTQSGADA